MYINFGYDRIDFENRNKTPKMASDVFGMQYTPDWALLASSWATPVATSYAINTQTKLYLENPSAMFDPTLLKETLLDASCDNSESFSSPALEQFILDGDGRCRIHDPLRYRADELNRLDFLNPDFFLQGKANAKH